MNKILLFYAFILTTLPICAQDSNNDRSMSDKYKKIYYTSIEDAERKLIQYQNERRSKEISDNDNFSTSFFPYEMFISLVKSDERTLTYDFNLSEIDEISSADGNVKLYNWIYGIYATTGEDSDGILTYMSKGRYRYYESKEAYDGSHDLVVPTDTYKIETVTLDEGSQIFLFIANHRDAVCRSEWVSAYIISGSSMEPYHIFNLNGELSSTLRCVTSIGGDYDGGIEYKNGSLLIPQEGFFHFAEWAGIPSGYKDIYKFNGQRFIYTGTIYDEGIPLNNKLRNFKHNVVCFEFLPWKVRIDYMPDGTFRYASWKNKDMSATPDLIINNGEYRFTEIDKGWQGKLVDFVFNNNGYEYVVSYEIVEYNRFNDLTPISLVVKQNGKVLMNVKHKES